MRNCLRHSKLELRGPSNGLKIAPPPRLKLWKGALCATSRADAESAHETGRPAPRGGPGGGATGEYV
eukprot:5082047-Alexandrium_andersonii.AAC.1